jgi:hypothetical protein
VRRSVWLALGGLLALGCAAAGPPPDAEYPSLVLPAHAPEKKPAATGTKPPPSEPAATPTLAAAAPASAAPEQGDLPDPAPLSERVQWSYPVSYDSGTIAVGDPELVCLPRPQATARRIGRFAFELWLGRELVDRLRFDFPLLATEEPPQGPRRPMHETPRFAPGAHVAVTLRLPASERATSARIYDRATGEVVAVPWPPRMADGTERSRHCPAAAAGKRARAAPARPTDAGR